MKLTEYKLKYTNRSIMVFEAITGKAFMINTITDQYLFFYSVLIANNPDTFKMTFDEFIDELDNDNTALIEFTKWLTKELSINAQTIEKKTPPLNQ